MFEKDGPTFIELVRQALQSTRGGYEMLAPKFDKTPFRTPDAIATRSVELLGEPVRSALDICSGTGSGLLALRPFTKERLVGVDFSPAMIAESKRVLGIESPLATNESPRIELIEKDVFAIDFDKEFEAATCFGALGHIPADRESEFLGLVRRALVPGGRFVFVTGTTPHLYAPSALIARGFNAAMRVRNALIRPPFIMYYLTFMLPEVERKLKWAGFDVRIHTKLFDPPFNEMVAIVARRI